MRNTVLLLALFAAGCSSTATNLSYNPPRPPMVHAGAPAILTVTVSDNRADESDPNYVGAIRGGFGNPLKTITSKRPIAVEVQEAFQQALTARHILGEGGRDRLVVQVTKLSGNQYVRRDARAAFNLQILDASGRTIYQDAVDVNRINGSVITFDAGIFASTDDLLAITRQAMTDAIDQALDKPGFLAALQSGA